MKRRQFIIALGGATLAWPLAARAQQGTPMRRVGMLMNNVATEPIYQAYVDTFEKTLQTLGWTQGRNLKLEIRWSAGDSQLVHSYAVELASMMPDVLVASTTPNLRALLPAAKTIPIVFVVVSDPVAQGFVSDLAHPGGNITGFAAYEFAMGGKWVDLLKQMMPNIKHIAVMFNPDTAPQSKLFLSSIEAAAPGLGVQVVAAPVHDETEIARAIEAASSEPDGGLLFPTDTFTSVHTDLIVKLAARYRLPAIYSNSPAMVRDGGLMYYGIDFEPQYRQVAVYVDRILRGAKPGDLPVQLATSFKLIVNLKTARELGLEVPMGLMLRADEMVE